MVTNTPSLHPLLVYCCFAFLVFCSNSTLIEDEATALLIFKNGADLNNQLDYSFQKANHHCNWEGVKCVNGSVVTYKIENLKLQGKFPSQSLSKLVELRIINLSDNSLSGPIPDLSPLKNLKSLFLNQNNFSGSFPPSVLVLERLVSISLSQNHLTGSLPIELIGLKNLISLKLNSNYFNGSLPPLDQAYLRVLNVSDNNLSGPLPWTKTLSRFSPAFFSKNPNLCGELIHKECIHPPHHHHHHHPSKLKLAVIITSIVIFAIICIIIVVIVVMKKTKKSGNGVGIGRGFMKKSMEMVRRHR